MSRHVNDEREFEHVIVVPYVLLLDVSYVYFNVFLCEQIVRVFQQELLYSVNELRADNRR